MTGFDRGRRRIFLFLAAIGAVILLMNLSLLSGTDVQSKIKSIPVHIPLTDKKPESGKDTAPDPNLPKLDSWYHDNDKFEDYADIDDEHPIAGYMKEADKAWKLYEDERSSTFKETVDKYRRRYGRHPPPGFRDWYKFAREKNVHNIDDFDQIMDDLRPFWGMEPSIIRSYAAHLSADDNNHVSGLFIRNKKIWKTTDNGWRMETFKKLVETCVQYLPDMDIAMNRLDQPRLVVPWDDMQALLKKELETRRIAPDAAAEWTTNMTGFLKDDDPSPVITDPKFFSAPGEQYMLIAKKACPPESHARDNSSSLASAEALYKDPRGGFITNFNRSSDLCTIGPEVEGKHGFLFAASTVVASNLLLPIFGECKVNVNSDILFPANMYYTGDPRYTYNPKSDHNWDDKHDRMTWRGVTSGGTNTADNWKGMHRQRLAFMTNETVMADKEVRIMRQDLNKAGSYENFDGFNASYFAKRHTDVGFTEGVSCIPGNCEFYNDIWTYKQPIPMTEQFQSKFLVDVDGASFSGRWRAFLQSKSLGIKSTIFREWHDSRLIPWRHFVPLDNRYDELYSILTYFIGLGKVTDAHNGEVPYVQRHDYEARRIGSQGREWAAKVLRDDDIEIYMFRLLIEYARIIDDNRDRIGYSGDGSELDKYDAKLDKVDSKHPWSGSSNANGAHG